MNPPIPDMHEYEQPGTTHNLVKDVRQALGLTPEQMAWELGCAQSTIWHCEQRRTLPQKPAVLDELRKPAKQAGPKIGP